MQACRKVTMNRPNLLARKAQCRWLRVKEFGRFIPARSNRRIACRYSSIPPICARRALTGRSFPQREIERIKSVRFRFRVWVWVECHRWTCVVYSALYGGSRSRSEIADVEFARSLSFQTMRGMIESLFGWDQRPRASDATMAAAEAKTPYSAIVLGATGNVGGRIVQLLIKTPLCKKVVVVTRRKTDAFADLKFSEVVVNMDRLEEEVAPHAQGVDVALAAFGVGKGSAKMPEEEVRKIEIAYPQAFCRAAKAGGARVCGVMTAAGADPEAGMKYAKIIGEKEKALESVKFDFLGVYRPAVILGNSNTPGVLGYVMPLLHWAMPSKYHSIHKNDLARAMVAQSQQAFLAIAQGNAPKEATVKILEYKEMEPFFVKGESDPPSSREICS